MLRLDKITGTPNNIIKASTTTNYGFKSYHKIKLNITTGVPIIVATSIQAQSDLKSSCTFKTSQQ